MSVLFVSRIRTKWVGIICFYLLFSILTVEAGIPHYINFQGRLTDASGTAVADGTYSLTFRLYSAQTGGTALWTETQSLTTSSGVFNAALGTTTDLDLDFDTQYWLSIQVGSDSEMTPRQRITAVGYTINADNLDSYTSGQFLRSDADDSASGQLTLTYPGTSLLLQPSSAPTADSKLLNVKNTDGTSIFSVEYEGDVQFSSDLTVSGATFLGGVGYNWPSADGTSGQALTTGANGTLSWSTVASEAVWTDDGDFVYPTDGNEYVACSDTGTRDYADSDGDLYVENDAEVDGNLYVTGTVSFTDDLTLSGTNMLYLADGTATAPSLSFEQDTNTGLYRPAADTLGITAGGTDALRLSHDGTNSTITSATGDVNIGTGAGDLTLASGVDIITEGNLEIKGDSSSRTLTIGDTGKASNDTVVIDADNWSVGASGDMSLSSDLTVAGTIWQGIEGPSAAENVMDVYNDVHNLHLYDYGRYGEMDAPIFANEERTIIDTNRLRQLEHGAIRQLADELNKVKQRLNSVVEENSALKNQLFPLTRKKE